jgi:hypothetical protein
MLYVISDTLLKMVLNTNTTCDQVLHYTSHIFEKGSVRPIKLVTMLYVIPDIVERVVKHK